MSRGLWLLAAVVACAPRPPAEVDPGPSFPAHSAPAVPSGALGQPRDSLLEWGGHDQWLAVCRTTGRDHVPRLIIDTNTELDFDRLEESDSSGRYVLIVHDGHRRLVDIRTHESHDLGAIAHVTAGDVRDGVLAYGRRGADAPPRVVLRTLETGQERELPSPTPWLYGVSIDSSGRGLWLTGLEVHTDEERASLAASEQEYAREQVCNMPTCRGFDNLPRHTMGLLWLGDGDETTFVDLDDAPIRPRALRGAVVYENEQGIELIHTDRRERIAGPGCHLDRNHYDPEALLLYCTEDDGERHYSLWKDDRLEPLGFVGSGDHEGVQMISGAGSRWLELGGLRTIQAVQHQRWGYAYGDHVMLVGDDVEIRDARTDTRVLALPGGFEGQLANGPYVALRALGNVHPAGRVIDIRDGHVVRTYDHEALRLAPTGQVLRRNDEGRMRWAP